MSGVFGRKPRQTLDWSDQRAIKAELGRARAALPEASAAVAEAAAALDEHMKRRELVGAAVALAREMAWSSGRDELIIRDPENPSVYYNVNADAADEHNATLKAREKAWAEVERVEGDLRVQLTDAGERRGYLKGQVRSLADRLDQLAAKPPKARGALELGPNATALSTEMVAADSRRRGEAAPDGPARATPAPAGKRGG